MTLKEQTGLSFEEFNCSLNCLTICCRALYLSHREWHIKHGINVR